MKSQQFSEQRAHRSLLGTLFVIVVLVLCAGHANAKPTLWLVGDSTVQVGTPGQQGWGTQLPQFFDPAKIRIDNRARGGRSSRTFLTEGLWDKALKEMKPGDFLIIQFGHNDSGPIGGEFAPGRAARASIRGNSDKTEVVDMPGGSKEEVRSYGAYLRGFVKDAQEKDVEVIIASPIPKRGFSNGKVHRDKGTYAGWAEEAAKQSGACFLNLNERIADKYDEMGEEASRQFFNDNVHTTPDGAKFNAQCVAEGIKDLWGCDLRRCLKR